MFFYRMDEYFSDPDDDALTFLMKGTPPQSGLLIDEVSGVLAGKPTLADSAASQPLQLEITVLDGKGGSSMQTFQLLVFNGIASLLFNWLHTDKPT